MDALVHNIAAAAGKPTIELAIMIFIANTSIRIPNCDYTPWPNERWTSYRHGNYGAERQGGSNVAVHERNGSPFPTKRDPETLA